MTKNSSTPTPAPQVTTNGATSIPIIAMVLGVVSLTTFTWFLGLPAIVLGAIGLKKYSDNRGFSMTGLITGIISTILLVGAIFLFLMALVLGVFHADSSTDSADTPSDRYEQRDKDYERRYFRSIQEDI